jgi:hypothetical protein
MAVLLAFPGAQLIDVQSEADETAEVISVDFGRDGEGGQEAGIPSADSDSMEGFEPDYLAAIPDADDDDVTF